MRRAKRCAKDSIIAELAACKSLASKQASEGVVGGTKTSFGGAIRALGKFCGFHYRGKAVPVAHLPDSHASHRERTYAPGRCSNSGRSPPGAAEKSRAARGCQTRSAALSCQEAKPLADAPSALAPKTLDDSRATAAPPP